MNNAIGNTDNIFAFITGIGGSVATIRISGKDSIFALTKLQFSNIKSIEHGKCVFGKIFYKEKFLDEVLITVFYAPNTFTGDNIVEISMHSSTYIIKTILSLLGGIKNFRHAQNGEFAYRAFLNGKIDLIKAEGINDIIHSETALQHDIASKQLTGIVGELFQKWKNETISLLSLIEVDIDFADEGIEIVREKITEKINHLKHTMDSYISHSSIAKQLKNGIVIPIVGEPNVGKSSIINILAKDDVAITSPTPGTTRDIISIPLDINGIKTILLDTAGLRDSDNEIEKEGIKRTIKSIEKAKCKIIVFDASVMNFDFHKSWNIVEDDILILNKIDLIMDEKASYNTLKKTFPNNTVISFSCKKHGDLSSIMNIIYERIKFIKEDAPMITSEKQLLILSNCSAMLEEMKLESRIEIIAEQLRSLIFKLSEVFGEITYEDVYDEIFSKFCLGK